MLFDDTLKWTSCDPYVIQKKEAQNTQNNITLLLQTTTCLYLN